MPEPQPEIGAEAILRAIEASAADLVFGIPGSSSVPLFHGLPSSKLEFVSSLDERGAMAMADGYARFAGPTALLLYMLPGMATALGNLYNAWRDETPLLVLVSQQSTDSRAGQGSVGEADLEPLASAFARFTHEVADSGALESDLELAVRRMNGPPTGPAVLVLPEDLLRAPIGSSPGPSVTHEPPPELDVAPVVEQLTRARRPLVVVGGQLRRTGGSEAMETLAAELDLPVLYEPFWNDRLGIAPGHQCALGQLVERSSLAADADLVLAIGCRMFNEVHPRRTPWFPADAVVVHVNADDEKLQQARGATHSIHADPAAFVTQLLAGCRASGTAPEVIADRRTRLVAARERRSRPLTGPFAPAVTALADALDRGYVVDESVSANSQLLSALRGERGERYVSTTGGSLGWGIGAACGVALATDAPVTCVVGDGAFFFGLQALWPAVARQLPITFVVLDNSGFGSTRWFESLYAARLPGEPSPHYVGSDFRTTGVSVCDVAQGFGVPSFDLEGDTDVHARLISDIGNGPRLFRLPIHDL
jgi:thiamine pyrophosphate-dependent acetolactate synthase large subunit-like protein